MEAGAKGRVHRFGILLYRRLPPLQQHPQLFTRRLPRIRRQCARRQRPHALCSRRWLSAVCIGHVQQSRHCLGVQYFGFHQYSLHTYTVCIVQGKTLHLQYCIAKLTVS
jgi:hypothetical protein